ARTSSGEEPTEAGNPTRILKRGDPVGNQPRCTLVIAGDSRDHDRRRAVREARVAEGERDGQVVDVMRETPVDGDDITVITHEPASGPGDRRRLVALAIVGAIVLVGLIAAFVARRDDDSTSVSTGPVASASNTPPTTLAPAQDDRAVAGGGTAAATKH